MVHLAKAEAGSVLPAPLEVRLAPNYDLKQGTQQEPLDEFPDE